MHQYLTAIGMESVKSIQELDRLLQGLEQENNERAVMSVTADKYDRCEYKKEFAKNIGIAAGGFQDSNGIFEREYIYPYFYGTGITTYADVTVERTKDQQSYIGICEDVKIGVTLMFRIQNYMEYLKKKWHPQEPGGYDSITLSGLCNEGKILLPVMKDESQKQQQSEDVHNRMMLVSAARAGDAEAIENLALDDIDIYTKVSRRLIKEDVFSIVDTYIMPYSVECDRYSILGVITGVRIVENIYTKEELYVMNLEVNDLKFDVCVPVHRVFGEPKAGRRFKGKIWMQGRINF